MLGVVGKWGDEMRLVCFCCVCKKAKPYDSVVSVRRSSRLSGDICVGCALGKGEKWIDRNVIARHQLTVYLEKSRLERELKAEGKLG